MGGAIAVHVAVQKLLPSLVGLAVIDVVEGEEHKSTSKVADPGSSPARDIVLCS